MKYSLLISLATTLLAASSSSSYSLAIQKNTDTAIATPAAVIHFPITKRNASPPPPAEKITTLSSSSSSSHRQRKRGVLKQSLINSVR